MCLESGDEYANTRSDVSRANRNSFTEKCLTLGRKIKISQSSSFLKSVVSLVIYHFHSSRTQYFCSEIFPGHSHCQTMYFFEQKPRLLSLIFDHFARLLFDSGSYFLPLSLSVCFLTVGYKNSRPLSRPRTQVAPGRSATPASSCDADFESKRVDQVRQTKFSHGTIGIRAGNFLGVHSFSVPSSSDEGWRPQLSIVSCRQLS